MNRSHRTALLSLVGCLVASAPAFAQRMISLNTGFMPDPRRAAGFSGGPVQAMGVQGNCRGYIPAQPQHILTTPTGFNFLRVFATSGGDTTLMIRSTTQTWCADDTYGANPGIDLNGLPPGRYDIYVGSYSAGTQHPYQLAITELQGVTPNSQGGGEMQPPPPPPPPPPVDPGGYRPPGGFRPQGGGNSLGALQPGFPPLYGRMMLRPRPGATVAARGSTGGSIPGSGVSGQGVCRGYYLGAPSHLLLLPTPQDFLRIYVMSAADSTLIVRRPDGQILCNDDTYGFNPAVEGNFPAGLYQVWVGSYRENEVRPYRITVTGNPSNQPQM